MVYDIFLLLGGIGLFLYGISFMSTSLKQAAGDNLRVVLGKLTSNGVSSVLIGIAVTALIQSSGAASVMTVGFVNAGLMELSQAIYVMLGANIGTTITAQIIAFKITAVAPTFATPINMGTSPPRGSGKPKRPIAVWNASTGRAAY